MENKLFLPDDILLIQENLSSHVSNKYIFRQDSVRTYSKVDFDGETDWSSKNMRRIHFSDCDFANVNFQSTGFTGSIFYNCSFQLDCNLCGTIFDECIFINCDFFGLNFQSTSFCRSEFHDSKIENCLMSRCFLTESKIYDTIIKNTILDDIIWESAILRKSSLINVNLKNLNMEFVYIDGTTFENTAIPFASVPFIFGGLKYISDNKNTVKIQTINPDYPLGWMNGETYERLLPDLNAFYRESLNYFPLCNILFSFNMIDEGIDSLVEGLKFWYKCQNYKMIFYLCDLANLYNFNINQRKHIFSQIEKLNSQIQLSDNSWLMNRWNIYLNKIRGTLLNSENMPHITLAITTLIGNNDYTVLCAFMETFEKYFLSNDFYFSVEIRHNSPFDLLYTIFSTPSILFELVVGIATIVGVCDQIYVYHVKKSNDINAKEYTAEQSMQIKDNVTKNIQNIQYNFYNCTFEDTNINANHFNRQSIGWEKPDSSGNNQ